MIAYEPVWGTFKYVAVNPNDENIFFRKYLSLKNIAFLYTSRKFLKILNLNFSQNLTPNSYGESLFAKNLFFINKSK